MAGIFRTGAYTGTEKVVFRTGLNTGLPDPFCPYRDIYRVSAGNKIPDREKRKVKRVDFGRKLDTDLESLHLGLTLVIANLAGSEQRHRH